MVVHSNVSIWIERKGFVKGSDGKLTQYEFDTANETHMTMLQELANTYHASVYLVREFVAVDADYQDHHPRKCAKDWYLLEVTENDSKTEN